MATSAQWGMSSIDNYLSQNSLLCLLSFCQPYTIVWSSCTALIPLLFSIDVRSVGFPGSAHGKEPTCQCKRCRDAGLIPGLGRYLGEGHGNPLQYSCRENSMDRAAWQCTGHGAPHRVRHNLSDLAHTHAQISITVLSFSQNHFDFPPLYFTGVTTPPPKPNNNNNHPLALRTQFQYRLSRGSRLAVAKSVLNTW